MMKRSKQSLATIGLIFITFLAAIQYVFLGNVPDTVSTFSFMCITNAIGAVLLGVGKLSSVRKINKGTLKKGAVFALELTGFNCFLLLGSRDMDSVMIASVVSLYFVFITPLLLLLKKRVDFFSGVATVIAIIALLLMFGADMDALFSSSNLIYLIIADVFFAAYVVSVSVMGEEEDPFSLSFSQMAFGTVFALIGWLIECMMGFTTFTLPTQTSFWISAVFIGIFIRVIYGVMQLWAQKYVSALKTSLIFSSEIIITLVTDPIMCLIFHKEYTPVTVFQVIGCVLFIISTLMIDDGIMKRLGYEDLDVTEDVDQNGREIRRTSVARKMIFTTLSFSLVTLVLSTVIFLISIHFIRSTAVENSTKLGSDASSTSMEAIMDELETNITNQVKDKTLLAEQKLAAYSDAGQLAASYVNTLYSDSGSYPFREVDIPRKQNAGSWTMQRTLANPGISYEDVRDECGLLGNMADVFDPIIRYNDNIATIYLGTEDGLLISYDPYSDTGDTVGEGFYEFRDSEWYKLGKNAADFAFTDSYQDSYGRGLTITCVAPVKNAKGEFYGCIGIDVLMSELNQSMVNDGIIDPAKAILIDDTGSIIAGNNADPSSENLGNISDPDIFGVSGHEILKNKNGIIIIGDDENANYIAYATIDSVNWTICISTPSIAVVQPALEIKNSIDDNTQSVVGSVVRGILNVIQSCLVLSALILIFVTLFAGRFSKRIADPLKKLEEDVRKISDGELELRTAVDTDDEIGSLAVSFNHMTDSLQKYISDLKEMTAKEERIAMELSLATSIQASMLPKNFGMYSDHKQFSLFASMTPAKEVGGDFYDFFLIDDTHLALVMADVSGKGVPAALFMARAKTSLKMRAMMGGTPSEILEDVNVQMCEGNDEELFVTVWLAIIDLETGKGLAANAGHEHPVLRRAGGSYELVVYRHSTMVASFEGAKFRGHEFELHPGDSLFVYTDGVPEATTNEPNVFFGTDRMLEALNKEPNAKPKQILSNVAAAIGDFAAGSEQFDDITMLCLKYHGMEADNDDEEA